MKFGIVFSLLLLIGCSAPDNKALTESKTSPDAKALNDSAVALYRRVGQDSANLLKAIALLDKATAVDSNYFIAYSNKISFLMSAKQYEKAIVASKAVIRINPDAPDFYGRTGILYEIVGDSVSAHPYFVKAGAIYDHILDTMQTDSPKYDMVVLTKGLNLVMMGEPQGNEIIRGVYDRQRDVNMREAMGKFVGKSKKEIIEEVRMGNTGK